MTDRRLVVEDTDGGQESTQCIERRWCTGRYTSSPRQEPGANEKSKLREPSAERSGGRSTSFQPLKLLLLTFFTLTARRHSRAPPHGCRKVLRRRPGGTTD